ncbi:hypothetical protein P775_01540 [Puniceibacterium antarcticum]|uniref:Ferric oxidoreductase domain-containing protein n=2 Tax=Puniceibacterium antarcticum TaxID=1206336 RepID=A0A2G8RLB9_9RHOB|nr:hypothetical protein P775_01540 [Puniceibacterium antarcticum]
MRGAVLWGTLGTLGLIPVLLAANSPLLGYRGVAYIIGGFAGIICLSILLVQPLLPAGYLPGVTAATGRWLHRWTGTAIVSCVTLHVGGLYITSPPDTLDALFLVSPTPFSVYGVIALWALLITALLVALRRRLPVGLRVWRLLHNALALVAVLATVIHAVQIDGAMEPLSKTILCGAVMLTTLLAFIDLRVIRPLLARRRRSA